MGGNGRFSLGAKLYTSRIIAVNGYIPGNMVRILQKLSEGLNG